MTFFHISGRPSDVTHENIPFGLDESGHLSIYGSYKAADAFSETARYRSLAQRLEAVRTHAFITGRCKGYLNTVYPQYFNFT